MSSTELLKTRTIPSFGYTDEEIRQQKRLEQQRKIEASLELQRMITEGIKPSVNVNQIRTHSAARMTIPIREEKPRRKLTVEEAFALQQKIFASNSS